MRFESGMLGFLIIVLAIGGGIAGTFLLSTETTTQEVTKYNLVADVTGLFDTDDSPQYMDYDLSKNYTGYYKSDTVINGVNYWGGATFTQSTSVNNYPVRYGPDNTTTSTETITLAKAQQMTTIDPPGQGDSKYTGVTYYSRAFGDGNYTFVTQTYTKTLTSFLSTMGLTGYDMIEIMQTESTSPQFFQLFFGTADDFGTGRPGNQNQTIAACYVEQNVYSTYPQDSYYRVASHSCKVNMITQTVDLYAGDTIGNQYLVKSVGLSDAVVSFSTVSLNNPGIPISVSEYDAPIVDYMDISQGVRVTGVNE